MCVLLHREEFEGWVAGILKDYPDYEARFTGVGYPATGPSPEGPCSQVSLQTCLHGSSILNILYKRAKEFHDNWCNAERILH